jgi:hypothetical protein
VRVSENKFNSAGETRSIEWLALQPLNLVRESGEYNEVILNYFIFLWKEKKSINIKIERKLNWYLEKVRYVWEKLRGLDSINTWTANRKKKS